MEPLNHQRDAHDEIVRRARAYFAGEWLELPVIPRWASLMVGPTGTGKTTVAAMAAATLGGCDPNTLIWGLPVSMLRVSAPNWMPCGSNNRGARETISVIAEHVARRDRTLLAIDEIDKLLDRGGDTSWKTYIRGEIFDLIDNRWPQGLTLPDLDDDNAPEITMQTLSEKLRHTVFILGIGTFQDWFDSTNTRRTMGFRAETNLEKDELTADIIAEKMPRELANRFNSKLIRIPELTQDDYYRIAQETEQQLPLRMRDAFRTEVALLLPAAIACKKGTRFLEEAMLATIVSLSPQPREIIKDIVKPNPEITSDLDLCTL